MKVWELISLLSQYPAGKEVLIQLPKQTEYMLQPAYIDDHDPEDLGMHLSICTRKEP